MEATDRHLEIETRFRELVEEAELAAPDAVGYEPESVVFYWCEPKLAVFVDFDDGEGNDDDDDEDDDDGEGEGDGDGEGKGDGVGEAAC